MKNILISGGTGLLGTAISAELKKQGFEIAYLSRSSGSYKGNQKFVWNISKGELDEAAIKWADVIIHLAGAGIADKAWTAKRKKEILDSRVDSTELIYKKLKEVENKVQKVVCASAIGFYGFADANVKFKESDEAANDFLATVTRKWEEAEQKIADLKVPLSIVRIGVVLSNNGGALPKLMQPVKYGVGAPVGNGKQILSWIHIADLANIFIHLMKENQPGIFNAVAPNPLSNAGMTRVIARKMKRPLILPNVPGFVLKLALGEMADVVLKGSWVESEKIISTGFKFKYPEIEEALDDLIK